MIHCPHCGGALDSGPRAELSTVPLGEKKQALLDALLDAWPKAARLRAIIEALYGMDPSGGPDDEKGTVRSHIYRLRKRLAPHGWTVSNHHGVGYRLERMEENMAFKTARKVEA